MKVKLFLFRLILFLIIYVTLELIGYLGMWVNSQSFDFLSNKNYFKIRAMLMGNKNPELFPRYLSLPYLGYIPYPGYKKHGVVQHNKDGYRGKQVPLKKTGKFRILCLGGSTTYGLGVALPSEAYPAQLEVLLNNYITEDSILKKKYNGAEVINAGVEDGNSAEELQQYLFKYRYYHADAVVVHSGINDALLIADASPDFQLDYTHYRRINFHLEPFSVPARWLLKSYFISFISIRLFYNNFSKTGNEFTHQYRQTFCKWTDVNIDSVLSKKQYGYYPFYENSKNLYSAIEADNSQLIILPNVLNKNSDFVRANKMYNDLSALNTDLSKSLCNNMRGIWIPLDFYSIEDTSYWIDDCHLNKEGECDKAEIVFNQIKPLLDL